MNSTLVYVIAITVLWVAGLLIIEYFQYKKGGRKLLITTTFREATKSQPWVFILLALLTGFMMGHCFGQ